MKPEGRFTLPPKVTVLADQGDQFAAASRARTENVCAPVVWPDVAASVAE